MQSCFTKISLCGLSLMGKRSILNQFLDKGILLFKHALICRHCWFVLALSALPRTTPYVWGYYRLSRLRLSSHLRQFLLDLVICLVANHYPYAGVRPTNEVSPPLGLGMPLLSLRQDKALARPTTGAWPVVSTLSAPQTESVWLS